MSKFINITNHNLTEDQKKDAIASLGVTEFVELPTNLKQLWGNVPTDLEDLRDFVAPIGAFVTKNFGDAKNIILCQGDIGAVFALMENVALSRLVLTTNESVRYIQKFTFIQSTTSRVDTVEESGVKKSVFKHVRFRTFGKNFIENIESLSDFEAYCSANGLYMYQQ